MARRWRGERVHASYWTNGRFNGAGDECVGKPFGWLALDPALPKVVAIERRSAKRMSKKTPYERRKSRAKHMDRRPQRYGKRQLLGWKAYKAWSPIGAPIYPDVDGAKRACSEHCCHPLKWEISVHTPEGHASWNGARTLEGRSASETYQASPHLEAYREDIPGAEFVSPDLECNVYIAPEGERWSVHTMVDLEGKDPFWVMHVTGGSTEQEGLDAAKLWNFFHFETGDRKTAAAYGRFLWGRALVRANSPPPATAGKLRERLRLWAIRWL